MQTAQLWERYESEMCIHTSWCSRLRLTSAGMWHVGSVRTHIQKRNEPTETYDDDRARVLICRAPHIHQIFNCAPNHETEKRKEPTGYSLTYACSSDLVADVLILILLVRPERWLNHIIIGGRAETRNTHTCPNIRYHQARTQINEPSRTQRRRIRMQITTDNANTWSTIVWYLALTSGPCMWSQPITNLSLGAAKSSPSNHYSYHILTSFHIRLRKTQ